MADEEKPLPPEEVAEAPKVKWEKREFAINDSMRQVCRATIVATEAEIANLKRKLQKLQYGG